MRPLPVNDDDLIPALRRGDPAALSSLYERFGGELLALATRMTGSDADAEDILHDLIVGLPEALRQYEERGKLRAWLKQIVVRMSLMRLRSARRLGDAAELERLPARPTGVSDATDSLERAFGELTPALREVVVLRLVEGFSHREVADLLGISVSASEARLSRGVAQLRRRLETLL